MDDCVSDVGSQGMKCLVHRRCARWRLFQQGWRVMGTRDKYARQGKLQIVGEEPRSKTRRRTKIGDEAKLSSRSAAEFSEERG